MKKIFCFVIACLLSMTCVFAIYAHEISIEDISLSNQNDMPDIISKNMQTDEITYISYSELISKHANNIPAPPISNSVYVDNLTTPASIIGTDDRTIVGDTTTYPYSAIIYIESTFDENQDTYC